MSKLLSFLNDLPPAEQAAFAVRCGTTVGYLRKAVSVGQKLREGVCIAIERESGGCVPLEELRPDVDWVYLRARKAVSELANAPAHQAQAAINSESEQGVTHA